MGFPGPAATGQALEEQSRKEQLFRPEAHSPSWLGVSSARRDVVRMEPIQQKVTGMIKGMENQAHEERLKGLLLFSLEKRDNDVIAPCKVINRRVLGSCPTCLGKAAPQKPADHLRSEEREQQPPQGGRGIIIKAFLWSLKRPLPSPLFLASVIMWCKPQPGLLMAPISAFLLTGKVMWL